MSFFWWRGGGGGEQLKDGNKISSHFGSSHFSQTARCSRVVEGFGSCCDRTLVCVCKTRTSSEIVAFLPFIFSLRFQVVSQPRRSARLAARFQSARSSPPTLPSHGHGAISDGLSDDPVLPEVEMFPAPSCFVCGGHFTSSGPLSRCVMQCCPISVHLQCVTDLVHLPSQSVVCPLCNSQSPSSLDFLHFQHLCCVPRGGSSRRVHDHLLLLSVFPADVNAFTTSAWLGQSTLAETTALSAHKTSCPSCLTPFWHPPLNTSTFPSISTRPLRILHSILSVSLMTCHILLPFHPLLCPQLWTS